MEVPIDYTEAIKEAAAKYQPTVCSGVFVKLLWFPVFGMAIILQFIFTLKNKYGKWTANKIIIFQEPEKNAAWAVKAEESKKSGPKFQE